MLSSENHTGQNAANREHERYVARDLPRRPVGIKRAIIVNALDCEEADVGYKNNSRLGPNSATVTARFSGQSRTGMMKEFQSSWSSLMNLRQK